MAVKPTRADAYQLLLEGSKALARVERNGIRVDVEYLDRTATTVGGRIEELERQMRGTKVYQTWHRRYKDKTKLGSREQLAAVLGQLGHRLTGVTATGRAATDKAALEGIDHPFVKKFLEVEKLKKAKSTYLNGIRREVCRGFLHPSFNLHTVETYRGSSDGPNFQNMPIRDPEVGPMIRRAFVPRDGRVLAEVDYGALEFRIAACFWKDPAMVAYASDPTLDVHRDMAALCYGCDPGQVSKMMRYCGKNMFVFPILYGSYYVQCAKNLWAAIDSLKLELKDGTPVKDHLRKKGIRELGTCDPKLPPQPGTFEAHIKKAEDGFNGRFPKFHRDKEAWWRKYQDRGYFDLMTGFRVSGVYSRNFLMNCPIQGPGFHCLLWSLAQLDGWLRKNKMGTLIVGQIHDCILLDVVPSELQAVLSKCREIMTESIKVHWPWVITRMEAEVDIVGEGETWYDKKPFSCGQDGVWLPA